MVLDDMSNNDEKMDSIEDIKYYLKEQLGFTKKVSDKVLALYIENIIRQFKPTFSGLNTFVTDHIKISGIAQKEITVEYRLSNIQWEFWKQELYLEPKHLEPKQNVYPVLVMGSGPEETSEEHMLDALAFGMGITKVTMGK